MRFFRGRGDWIRTSGLYVPNVALYQAEPHLDGNGSGQRSLAAEEGFEPSQTESESVVLPLHNSAIRTALLETARFIIPNHPDLSIPFPDKMKNPCRALPAIPGKGRSFLTAAPPVPAAFTTVFHLSAPLRIPLSAIARTALLISSSVRTSAMRTCPSPEGPNAEPGVTSTPVFSNRSRANAALSE